MKNKLLRYYKIIFPLAHLIAVSVLALLLYYIYNETLTLLKDQFNEQQLLVSRQTAIGIEKTINAAVRELEEVSREPSLQTLNIDVARKVIKEKFDHLKGINLNDAGLLDAKGVIRISLGAPHFEGAYFLYRDYFKKVKILKENKVLFEFITVEFDRRQEKAIIASMPIYSTRGNFCCAVFLNILIDELIKDFLPVNPIERKIWIIDSKGDFLYTPLSQKETTPAQTQVLDPSFMRFIEEAKGGKPTMGEFISPMSVKTIAASYPIRAGDFSTWHVIITTPEELISTLIKSTAVKYTIVTLIVMLVVVSTSFLIIYVINRWNLELDSIVKARTKDLQNYAAQLEEARNNSERTVEERTRELNRTHKALVQKEKLAVLGELAASVSHELRNPLGVIKNAIYFFKMRLHTFKDEEIKENIQLIDKEITTANKIISDLLDFTRDKTPVRLSVDLNNLVKEMLSKASIPNNIKVITELTESMITVSADPTQIAQVFSNLIENALQAMEDGGTLRVATKSNGTAEVVFADDGCGIPQDNLEKIFEPLFTTKTKGIGLGLAISKSLIESNGGSISAESNGTQGSTFTVTFSRSK